MTSTGLESSLVAGSSSARLLLLGTIEDICNLDVPREEEDFAFALGMGVFATDFTAGVLSSITGTSEVSLCFTRYLQKKTSWDKTY
jgi:hypothetical protein